MLELMAISDWSKNENHEILPENHEICTFSSVLFKPWRVWASFKRWVTSCPHLGAALW
jgi:hypothetical protein